ATPPHLHTSTRPRLHNPDRIPKRERRGVAGAYLAPAPLLPYSLSTRGDEPGRPKEPPTAATRPRLLCSAAPRRKVSLPCPVRGNEARFINDDRGIKTAGPNAESRDVWVNVGNGKLERRIGVFAAWAVQCVGARAI
ncbi:hypothetical protein LTR60_006918, partial [Cryomyces antarcticus]